jgi:hypothetical protein
MYKVVSYNCKNLKTNNIFIDKLIQTSNITFLCEHWLAEEEEYYCQHVSKEKNVLFHGSFSLNDKHKGRPHGGYLWAIDKDIKINKYEHFSKELSRVDLNVENENISIIGVWLQFDNNSSEALASFELNLSIISSIIDDNVNKNISTIVIGDFNADLNRKKRFDQLLVKFKDENLLSNDECKGYSYRNGQYESKIDHIFVKHINERVCLQNFMIVNDELSMSDHTALSAVIKIENDSINDSIKVERKMHVFDWGNAEFIREYQVNLNNFVEMRLFRYPKATDTFTQYDIDKLYKSLCTTMLRSARKAEKDLRQKNQTNQNIQVKRKFYHSKNTKVFKLINQLNLMKNHSQELNKNCIRNCKRLIRIEQRKSLEMKERKRCFDIQRLRKYKRQHFWKAVKNYKRNRSLKSQDKSIDINDFGEFYKKLFSNDNVLLSNKQKRITNDVIEKNEDLKYKFMRYSVTDFEMSSALKSLKLKKSIGYDNIPAEMLYYVDYGNYFDSLKVFYSLIFSHGYVPSKMNISYVTPIPKGKKVSNNPADYRPISVSTSFANVFETLLLNNIDIMSMISKNQFGYKHRCSCKHAYFTVNETIEYYRTNGSQVYLASLDAQKAFDKLWRIGLFHKLNGKIPDILWRIIFDYYSKSSIMVRLNNIKSDLFQTTGGVKQGGILSPYLFNFFINELIEDCLKSNIGCRLGGINVSIVAYCDDIILISPLKRHLQKLLDICYDYSVEWLMKFNPEKSVVMSMDLAGAFKGELVFNLGSVKLKQVENLIYLGLPMGDFHFQKLFWEEKMKKVMKAFHSLRDFGCRSGGLDPHSIAQMYRTFCQPILTYGFEMCRLSKKQIKDINVKQSSLIKNAIGVSKYSKSSALMEALKIDTVEFLYLKYKFLFQRQLREVDFTLKIYNFLRNCEFKRINNNLSFMLQLDGAKNIINEIESERMKDTVARLKAQLNVNMDETQIRRISNICKLIGESNDKNYYQQILKNVLRNRVEEVTYGDEYR